MNRKGITKLIIYWIGPDWTRYVHWIGSIHQTVSDLCIRLDRLVVDVWISNWTMDRGSRANPTEGCYAQQEDGDDRDGKLGSEYGI
jgi:hypothetical protein